MNYFYKILLVNSLTLGCLYSMETTDVCALDSKGESLLDKLIFSRDDSRGQKARTFIELGISLDTKDLWFNMSFVQMLKVKIKKGSNQADRQLLETVQKAVISRNMTVFQAVQGIMTKDTANIVLSYYVDQEKFDQTDAEIDKLAVCFTKRQAEHPAAVCEYDRISMHGHLGYVR